MFSGVIPPDTRNEKGRRPGAWFQRPIAAWLAGVPIVPVLRNDHCYKANSVVKCIVLDFR